MLTQDVWTIEVATSDHDAVKVGVLEQRLSRVHLSKVDWPDRPDAEKLAMLLAMSVHGGMATRVVHCL